MSICATTTVTVENVPCPDCRADDYTVFASGPDYEHHTCDQDFQMVQCRRCQVVYLNPRPTIDMLPIIYPPEDYCCYKFEERNGSIMARARAARQRSKIKRVFNYVQNKDRSSTHVLDIGAGDGTLLQIFHSMGIPKENLCGLEIAPEAVESLEQRGFQACQGRAEEMDLPSDTFDLATLIQVIEHLEDPRSVLESVHRVLRPGGTVLVETPNVAGWDQKLFARRRWGGYHFPRHWVLYSPTTLSRLLNECGFEVVETTTLAATFVLAWSANHFLQDIKAPRFLQRLFDVNSFLAMSFFMAFDWLPGKLGKASNMRVIARKM